MQRYWKAGTWLAVGMALSSTVAWGAAQTPPSAPVTVVNSTSNPVPVTGTVSITGDVAGGVQSLDENVTLYSEQLQVTSTSFFVSTPEIDVKAYKEVRVVIERDSCGPCATISAGVLVKGSKGFLQNIDAFSATSEGVGVGQFASRTYTVPGDKMQIYLRAGAGGTSNSVSVLVIGRAN